MFEPRNDLERRLGEMAVNATSQTDVDRILRGETVFVAAFVNVDGAGDVSTPAKSIDAASTSRMADMRYVETGGVRLLPVFTSSERILDFSEDEHEAVPTTIERVRELLPDVGFVLNPRADLTTDLSAVSDRMRSSYRPVDIDVSEAPQFSVPTREAEEICGALASMFGRTPSIRSAHLSTMNTSGASPALLLEVVTTRPATVDPSTIASVLQRYVTEGHPIDFRFCRTEDEVMARAFVPPFYVKKSKSFLGRLFGR